MESKNYYVYIYLNQTKSGEWVYKDKVFNYQPFYVGKGVKRREIEHLCPYMLKRKNIKSSIIKSILSKTGEEPIHYRLYENLTNEQAIQIEKELIAHFGRLDIGTGILANGTDGGDGANNFSEETLKKVGRNKIKVYQYDLDGKFIKEWESLSSVDCCKNVSNISTAIKRGGTFCNSLWSYEKVKKLDSKKKYQMPVKYNKIEQVDVETGEILNVYDNALEIEQKLKLRKGARNKIYECIKNKIKTAYGYKWKYKSGNTD